MHRGDVMSIAASIDIRLHKKRSGFISRIELIKRLLDFGWVFDVDGTISYLPIGDHDGFDWQFQKIGSKELFKILTQKEKNNERIGVSITWEETSVGGILLLQDDEISFSIDINRKRINDSSITDVSWYLPKLILPLNFEAIQVESIEFREHV